ncbi:hypothetical protein CDCA_CDCA08G2308 [Cyanidium caldarium]|uniref:Uncharacterized protein n=1 Tax=Cyanidium caldarium TaxID=2771 RepID=A0AAV9IWV2_CYACA|nr:hypothetical protein CDCA_CDCA08G2308 [Cyanidium caldarium]
MNSTGIGGRHAARWWLLLTALLCLLVFSAPQRFPFARADTDARTAESVSARAAKHAAAAVAAGNASEAPRPAAPLTAGEAGARVVFTAASTVAVGESGAAAAAARVAAEVRSEGDAQGARVTKLEEQVRRLEGEVARVRSQLSAKDDELARMAAELSRAVVDREQMAADKADLADALTKVQAEVVRLRAQKPPPLDLAEVDLAGVLQAKTAVYAQRTTALLQRYGVTERWQQVQHAGRRAAHWSGRRLHRVWRWTQPRIRRLRRHTWRTAAHLYHHTAPVVSRWIRRLADRIPEQHRRRVFGAYAAASTRLLEYTACVDRYGRNAARQHPIETAPLWSSVWKRSVRRAHVAVMCFRQADAVSRLLLAAVLWVLALASSLTLSLSWSLAKGFVHALLGLVV